MRLSLLPVLLAAGAPACSAFANALPTESWTCAWDASVVRPLADPGAPVDDAGVLSPGECQTTCGPPVDACTRTELDGGQPAAICPVCTF